MYNQVNHIIYHRRHKHLLTDVRSYAGKLLTNNHKLVKLNLNFNNTDYGLIKKKETRTAKINIGLLSDIANLPQCHKEYKSQLNTRLYKLVEEKTNKNNTIADSWITLQAAFKESGITSAGTTTRKRPCTRPCNICIVDKTDRP